MNKRDVRTSENLQIYLQECAEKSDRLYHYTTLESILCIIRNHSFRLTRMDLMNDKAEKKLGQQRDQSENYVMSFTRDKEYVSMWAMYGNPSGIKLRLDFDRSILQKNINDNFYIDSKKEKKISVYKDNHKSVFSKTGWVLSDVVYLDKDTNEFRHKENVFPEIKADEYMIEDLAGFIKYDAWEFERENRLRVNVIAQDVIDSKYPEHIYAGIDDSLINTFHITFNPWLSSEMKEVVRTSLREVAGQTIVCDDSKNDGEICELR